MQIKTFDEIPAENHKEIAIKVIKLALKNYHGLSQDMYPSTGAVKTETLTAFHPGDIFCLKIDLDNAIKQLPLNLRKVIIMAFIEGWPVSKICSSLGNKFRVDFTVP